MQCSKCGKENNPFAKYCEYCGEELPEVDMETAEDGYIDETQELKISEAAPVSDAVRQEQHIGNMPLENLGDQETFEPQMLSFNTQSYYAAQATLGYRNPNDIPIVTAPKQIDKDGFVPSSAFAGLKEPKKQRSKARTFFVIMSILIILSIISFFAAKAIIENLSTKFMREHTSQFVVNACQLSVNEVINGEELIRIFSPENKSHTLRKTVKKNKQSTSIVFSADSISRRLFLGVSSEGGKNNENMKLFANMEKCSLAYANGKDSFDYYLPLKDLRNSAQSLLVGAQWKDRPALTQEQYNSLMDLYEYIYNFIQKDDESEEKVSSLQKLFEKICDDIDKNVETEIRNEQVSVEGSEKSDVYLIQQTTNGKQLFAAVYEDIKAWAESSSFMSGDVKAYFLRLAEKLNPSGGELLKDVSSFEMTVQHYINRADQSLMQTVINASVNGEKSETRIYFGAEPSKSDRIVLTTNAIKSSAPADPNQSSSVEANRNTMSTLELSREKTTLTNTYTLLYSTPDHEAQYVLVRDNSTGEYTLESTVKESATSEPVTTKTTGIIKFDVISFSWLDKSKDGTETEYYYSNRAEMEEIASDNNICVKSWSDVAEDIQTAVNTVLSEIVLPVA